MERRIIPSNQVRGMRQIASFPITQDNLQQTVDLPRGPHIESVQLRVSGSANITTLFTTVRNIATYRFLRRADWVINSNVTLDSVSGPQLVQQYVMRRNAPILVNPLSAAVSLQPFDATFIFDRSMPDGVRPKDSYLQTDFGMSNNQLRLQFGALSDMFIGSGVASYSGVSASVSVTDYQEQQDKNGMTPSPGWYGKRNGSVSAFSAAANGQQIKVSTGNRLRFVSLRVLDAVTQEPNPALLSRIKLSRAGDTRVDMAAIDVLRGNQANYGQSLLAGQYIIDLAYNGAMSGVRYSEFWPIPNSADTFLFVDTTSACIVEVSTFEGVDW